MTAGVQSVYDPREAGAGGKGWKQDPPVTGIVGVLFAALIVIATVMMLVACAPLLLLGVAELVTCGPTYWRVRWRRNPNEEAK